MSYDGEIPRNWLRTVWSLDDREETLSKYRPKRSLVAASTPTTNASAMASRVSRFTIDFC
jgi:hypothetical protein